MADNDSEAARTAAYVCSIFSIVILLTRLGLNLYQRKPIDLNFYFIIASVIVVAARIITNEFYLEYGTASQVRANPDAYVGYDMELIKTGSILVLIARLLLTAALWLQMGLLLNFYSNILSGITVVAHMIKIIWASLGLSFLAIILATFLECHPIELYWETEKDPGKCADAYTQLLLQGICNIVIDLMLLFITYPLIVLRGRSWSQSLRLYLLFGLGFFCIIITIIRLVFIFEDQDSAQTTRSLWASIQVIVSTFVANAPSIYGALRVFRRQRSSQRSVPHNNSPPGPNASSQRRESQTDTDIWLRLEEDVDLSPIRRGVMVSAGGKRTFYDVESQQQGSPFTGFDPYHQHQQYYQPYHQGRDTCHVKSLSTCSSASSSFQNYAGGPSTAIQHGPAPPSAPLRTSYFIDDSVNKTPPLPHRRDNSR